MEKITSPITNLYDFASIFNVYKDADGIVLYNLYNTINIDGDIDPSLYTEKYITEGDNWYSLSYKYYNTTYLWWTFLVVNKIDNPFDPIPVGKIKILKANVISQILNQMNSQ